MSDLLKQFLKAWLEWAEDGAEEDRPFSRCCGLCSNFENWMFEMNLPYEEACVEYFALGELFKSDGLHGDYPFGGMDQYEQESDNETIQLNPARLAWVREKVKQYETV